MNKFYRISSVIAVFIALLAFAGVTAAFNQGQNEAGAGMGFQAVDEAVMHEAIANALGLTIEEFEAAIAEGKTVLVLAEEQGIDFAEVQAAMDAVHAAVLQQAVDEGLVSQEQADWMLGRHGRQNGQGSGMNRGQGNGPAGRMGRGAGNNGGQPGECLYQVP